MATKHKEYPVIANFTGQAAVNFSKLLEQPINDVQKAMIKESAGLFEHYRSQWQKKKEN